MDYLFPIITSIISFLFFLSVSEQYIRKRRPHQLVWSVSMFLFFITAGAEAVSLIVGSWNPIVYRAYYLFAAIQVSLMGGGLIYLFTTHNVINERNAAKATIILGWPWVLFSYLLLERDVIFYAILIPTGIMIIAAFIYLFVKRVDKIRFHDTATVYLCLKCRKEYLERHSDWSADWKVETITPSSKYRKFYHQLFKGQNFAHLFIVMAIYLFMLMNVYVWTEPLNIELLKSGKEVSGLGWENGDVEPSEIAFTDRAFVRLFSPFHTIPGAIALIGGGVYSYITWQKSIRRNTGKFSPMNGIYNIYIAFGAWVLGIGATGSGLGLGTLYISEVISVTFMYFGFLESDRMSKEKFLSIFDISWIWKRGCSTI